ncbi:MAG: tyrosine-type recombinase/integrase [Monoglobaceae bacterium]
MKLTKRSDGRYCKTKTINGERIFFYSTEPTERKAIKDIENQMVEYNGKIQRGKLFKDVATEWEHYEKIAHQTMIRYKRLCAMAVEHFGNSYIKNINTEDIALYLDELVYRKYSSKTIKDEMSVLNMIFKYAAIKRYISSNPTLYITPPDGAPKVERNSLTDDEIKGVENNIDKEFGLLVYFLLYSGLRKGEALALKYGDIDFDNNIIHVTKAVEFIGNVPHIKSPKTVSGKRNVPLVEKLKKKLPHGNSNDIIFGVNGELMNKSYFERHWTKYREQTGLNITAHQLLKA